MGESNINRREVINQRTTMFHSYIIEYLEKNNIEIDSFTLNIINDILYLINANYYYKISSNYHIDRETLIVQVLNQIMIYLTKKEDKLLDEDDVTKIINSCFFIKSDLQQAFIQEFFEVSNVVEDVKIRLIENRYLNSIDHKKEQAKMKNTFYFDSSDRKYYQALVEGLSANDKYFKEYGNINNIEWDYSVLENVVKIILSYRDEIKRSFEVETYSDFNLISSYIYNVICYSIMNQQAKVTYQSLIATFKDWEDVPYKIKLKITSAIIKELNLTEINSPFIVKYKPKENHKIINFATKKGK